MTAVLTRSVEDVVRSAGLAPSLHNTQPWRWRLADEVLELRADLARHLPATDPDGRQLVTSCGAALLSARLAVRLLGRLDRVVVLPDRADPSLLAALTTGPRCEPTAEERRLHAALPLRRTARYGFLDEPVPRALLVALQQAAAQEGAELRLVEHPGHRRALAELVAAADRADQAHPAVRAERDAWTPEPSQDRPDGVPATSYPRVRPAPAPDELVVRDFSGGRPLGRSGSSPAAGAPVAAVLLTPSDTRRDWLVAGQALQRVLLTAAASGVQASLHSQPLGHAGLRLLVRDELPGTGSPQMLLQLGYAEQQPPTSRRPVHAVLDVPARTRS